MPQSETLSDPDLPYKQAAQQSTDGILIVQDGRVVYCNQALEDIVGHPLAHLSSRPFPEFIHPDDRPMVLDHHVRRLRGEQLEPSYQFQILHAHGHPVRIELSAQIIAWGGRPATWSCMKTVSCTSSDNQAPTQQEAC